MEWVQILRFIELQTVACVQETGLCHQNLSVMKRFAPITVKSVIVTRHSVDARRGLLTTRPNIEDHIST